MEPMTDSTRLLIDPDAASKIIANRERLRPRAWGGNDAVCMMSALVSGAQSTKDCVTQGWPEWLATLNVYLFDQEINTDDQEQARYDFALAIAGLVQTPRDYDSARDLFLISRLDTGGFSALKTLRSLPGDWQQAELAVDRVVALLKRRLVGEDVAQELRNTHFFTDVRECWDLPVEAASWADAVKAELNANASKILLDAISAARADLISALRECSPAVDTPND